MASTLSNWFTIFSARSYPIIRQMVLSASAVSDESVITDTLYRSVLQDVYKRQYISRGGVFANAQTGNIVLLGIHIAQQNFEKITTYTLPILAFMVGVMITEIVKLNFRYSTKIHWRQIVIALEILVLLAVSFVPEGICNDLVNTAVSFVCSMQVESFRAFGGGKKYATTMCTGNLRTATENLFYSGVHLSLIHI